MAEVVLGLATSHGPMLTIPPELWSERVKFDRALPLLAYQGRDYRFDELISLRADERLAEQCNIEVGRVRARECKEAIGKLASTFERAAVDHVVLVGNDQMEVFDNANLPAFLICWAEKLHNIPFSDEQKRLLGPGIADAEPGHHGPEHETYPGLPELGRFLIEQLLTEEFDVAASNALPEIPGSRSSGAPHAFGFVYRKIFRGRLVPNVPLFLNTFYPPNQPSMKRCLAFGRAIGRAIKAWPGTERVAVIGSGGLSHFVIDEKTDRRFLDAIQRRDFDEIAAIPEPLLRAGTSELKNWATTAAILDEVGLPLSWYDYIPCYRSEAGTGAAMAFAEWE